MNHLLPMRIDLAIQKIDCWSRNPTLVRSLPGTDVLERFEARVKVTLSVVSAEKLPTPRPVVAGWGPTIAYREKLFAGRILVCGYRESAGSAGATQ